MVRRSESLPGCLVLSVNVGRFFSKNKLAHYLIIQNKNTFLIKGFSKEFKELESLILHCSIMRDMLPVVLNLKYHEVEQYENKCDFVYYSSNSSSSLVSTISTESDFSTNLSSFDSMHSLFDWIFEIISNCKYREIIFVNTIHLYLYF